MQRGGKQTSYLQLAMRASCQAPGLPKPRTDTIHGDHGNDMPHIHRRLDGQTDKLENRKVIIGPARHIAHARLVNVTVCKFYFTTDKYSEMACIQKIPAYTCTTRLPNSTVHMHHILSSECPQPSNHLNITFLCTIMYPPHPPPQPFIFNSPEGVGEGGGGDRQ